MSNPSRLSPFDEIRRETEDGTEYWSARDMAKLLEYARWDKFKVALGRDRKRVRTAGKPSQTIFSKWGN